MSNTGKFKVSILLSAMALSFTLTSPAYASLNDQLGEIFNGMANVTQPGVYETQRRGVVSGGSVVTRSKIMDIQFATFTPPSIKAGCGGIDLFMGSFSFIDAEQFIQFLRAVASNAAGYAFQIALGQVCPDCLNNLQSLSNKIQSLNQYAGNSCQLAKGIVDTGMDLFEGKKLEETSLANTWKGLSEDWFGAKNDPNTSTGTLKKNNPTEYAKRVTGNIVWRALASGDMAGSFSNSGSLREDIMSVTGTVIYKDQVDVKGEENIGGKTNPISIRPKLIDLRDLVDGGNVKVYRCKDGKGEDQCLDVGGKTGTTETIVGLKQRLEQALLGSGNTNSIGIIEKFGNHNSGVDLTAEEKNILSSMPESAGAVIRNLSIHSTDAAKTVARRIVGALAVEMAYQTTSELIEITEMSLNSLSSDADRQQALGLIDKARADLDSSWRSLTGTYGKWADQYAHANLLLGTILKNDVRIANMYRMPNTNTATDQN